MIDVSKKLPDGKIRDQHSYVDGGVQRSYVDSGGQHIYVGGGQHIYVGGGQHIYVDGYPATFGKRPVQLPDGDATLITEE